MKFGQATPQDTAFVREIPRVQIHILWVNDFYDGPIQGMAEIDGTRAMFDMIDRDVLGSENEDRTYWLVSLDPVQLADEERWHELFCEKVGTHFDYTDRAPIAAPASEHRQFYDKYAQRTEPDYSRNEIVGWFRY